MNKADQPGPSEGDSGHTTAAVVRWAEIEIRPVRTPAEYRACVELQRLTWGADFSELVPASILKISREVGGIVVGAFDPEGDLLGFVFGLTGVEEGRLVHWSHMLAVRSEVRNRGLGRRLKQFQADALRGRGVERIYWTFDPLVARNAHLNLNRLGVAVREYVPDMYGGDTGSELHSGLGTDRFVVVWHLEPVDAQPAVRETTEASMEALAELPLINAAAGEEGDPRPTERPLEEVAAARIEIPRDIQAVKAYSRPLATEWRRSTRRAFGGYLERGYVVDGFYCDDRTDRCFYIVRRPHQSSDPTGG